MLPSSAAWSAWPIPGGKTQAAPSSFILHQHSRYLDGRYTVIGRVVDGMEIVDGITQVVTDKVGRWGPKDRPIENVVMTQVQLSGRIGALVESGEIVLASSKNEDAGKATDPAAPAQASAAKTNDDTVTASN